MLLLELLSLRVRLLLLLRWRRLTGVAGVWQHARSLGRRKGVSWAGLLVMMLRRRLLLAEATPASAPASASTSAERVSIHSYRSGDRGRDRKRVGRPWAVVCSLSYRLIIGAIGFNLIFRFFGAV